MNGTICNMNITPPGLSIRTNNGYVFLFVVQIFIMVLNVLLNGTLCFRVARVKSSARRPCHVLVLHQAIVNLLIAGFCQSTVVLKLLPWSFDTFIKLARVSSVAFAILRASSVCNIVLLGVDRYRYIVTFSTYKLRTSYRRMVISVIFTWLLALAVGLSPIHITLQTTPRCWNVCLYTLMLTPHSEGVTKLFYIIYFLLFFVSPCVIMITTSCLIYSVALKHRNLRVNSTGMVTQPTQRHRVPNPRGRMGVKAARVLLFSICTYLCCFTPYFISTVLAALGLWTRTDSPPFFLLLFHILLFIHTIIDPFLNGFGSNHIKKGFCLLPCPCMKRQTARVHPVHVSVEAALPSCVSPVTASWISTVSANVERASLFSREDLVSRDFLEVYRSNRSTPAADAGRQNRRQSWRYLRGSQAWITPRMSQQDLFSSHASRKTGAIRSMALRSIGETAVALAFPTMCSKAESPDVRTRRVSRQSSRVFSRPSQISSDTIMEIES